MRACGSHVNRTSLTLDMIAELGPAEPTMLSGVASLLHRRFRGDADRC
jgi:hypothetical protein